MQGAGDSFDPGEIVRVLEDAGYRILRRENGWHECLLVRDDERWHGSGFDADSALLDALNQAFPSHLSRVVFAERLARGTSAAETPASTPPSAAEPELPFAAPTMSTAAFEAARVEPEAERAVWDEPRSADAVHEVASEAARGQARVFRLHQEEALEMLLELQEEIRATVDEAALWAPERQRLLILKWIAFARGVQDQARAKGVESRVYAIAQELGKLAKIWWPGSVPALQLTAQPSECQLGLGLEREPRSWAEVADAATDRLIALLETDESLGLGEQGWADDAHLVPGPTDPELELRTIARKLEDWTGSLSQAPAPRDQNELGDVVLEEARVLAEKLRWLRGSVEDSWTWGASIGRLRWMSWGFGRRTQLHEVLDPSFRPLRTWAQRLGFDPQKKEKVKKKNLILKSFPSDVDATRDALLAWLHGALACELLSSDRLAEMLEPHRELLGDLGPDALPGLERRHRKKLRKLQARLSGEAAADPALAEQDDEDKDEDKLEVAGVASAAQPLDERLLTSVRASVAGKRALLVTNRADPDLDESLANTFGFASVEHCEHSDRRIQSAAKRIAGGSYDLVLSATGFQPHKVDSKLRKASVDAGIPYVRVNRARRQACLRALARELGLLHSHGIAG